MIKQKEAGNESKPNQTKQNKNIKQKEAAVGKGGRTVQQYLLKHLSQLELLQQSQLGHGIGHFLRAVSEQQGARAHTGLLQKLQAFTHHHIIPQQNRGNYSVFTKKIRWDTEHTQNEHFHSM